MVIALFGLLLFGTLALFIAARGADSTERKDAVIEDDSTRVSLKKLKRLERERARQAKEIEKQRKRQKESALRRELSESD